MGFRAVRILTFRFSNNLRKAPASSSNRVLRSLLPFLHFLRDRSRLIEAGFRNRNGLRKTSHHARTALYMISYTHEHFGFAWHPQVSPGPNPHQPNSLSASNRISLLLPRHHAPRHPSGNLLIHDFTVFGGLRKDILLVYG